MIDTNPAQWILAIAKLRSLTPNNAQYFADSEQVYQTWFAPLRYLHRDGNTIFLRAPHECSARHILRRYTDAICNAYGDGVDELDIFWPDATPDKCPPRRFRPPDDIINHGAGRENAATGRGAVKNETSGVMAGGHDTPASTERPNQTREIK